MVCEPYSVTEVHLLVLTLTLAQVVGNILYGGPVYVCGCVCACVCACVWNEDFM